MSMFRRSYRRLGVQTATLPGADRLLPLLLESMMRDSAQPGRTRSQTLVLVRGLPAASRLLVQLRFLPAGIGIEFMHGNRDRFRLFSEVLFVDDSIFAYQEGFDARRTVNRGIGHK